MRGRVRNAKLGERIRELRKERGLSLQTVGGEDFSRAFLSQVELGRSQPSTRVLRIIADRLGAPVEYLLEGEVESVDRQIELERGRIRLRLGDPEGAWMDLEPLLAAGEWPFWAEVRLAAAAVLSALGRPGEAGALLSAVAQRVPPEDDYWKRRLESARRLRPWPEGEDLTQLAHRHLRLADRLYRQGHEELALEHYRTGRVLLEAAAAAEPGTTVGRIAGDLSGPGRRPTPRRSSGAEPKGRR